MIERTVDTVFQENTLFLAIVTLFYHFLEYVKNEVYIQGRLRCDACNRQYWLIEVESSFLNVIASSFSAEYIYLLQVMRPTTSCSSISSHVQNRGIPPAYMYNIAIWSKFGIPESFVYLLHRRSS